MHPIKIITVEKSRDLERRADEGGLSYAALMENAGRALALAVQELAGIEGKQVVALVGPGNNGGDGLVAAHYLSQADARVICYIWKRTVEDDWNYRRIQDDGVPVVWMEDDPGYEKLRSLLSGADVVLDALLGVGVSRPIGGSLAEILTVARDIVAGETTLSNLEPAFAASRAHPAPVVIAVDCPTGLDCDTGALDPASLPADMTVTFAHAKEGLLRFPGAEAVGEIWVADIGIPPRFADDVPLELATPSLIRSCLPSRPGGAHKGTFGRALIVAGSVNYVGAAVLAGTAATRVGAGLVTMALPTPIQPVVASRLTEATYVLLPHDLGVIAPGAKEILAQEMDECQALLVGPGLTQEEVTVTFVRSLLGLESTGKKERMGFLDSLSPGAQTLGALPRLVVDADGLNALATADEWWAALPQNTVITPHPGEMARLMGGKSTVREIQADREGIAARMAEQWGVVVVLKGAFTVVAEPAGRLVVLPFANPGMATAGSGDVLSGAIAGLRAQGASAFEAAVAGAYLHGQAGEMARTVLGDMGMVAGDLLPRLPLALKRVRQGDREGS
ncbi:NAD(P)H-hydrate dehydratase [Chloroflexota bacterium]